MDSIVKRSLVFPTLKFQREIKMCRSGKALPPGTAETGIDMSVYTLDWSRKEEHDREHFNDWVRHTTKEKIPFVPALPTKWNTFVNTLEFAPNDAYITQIKRSTAFATMFWQERYPFDTSVRDICLIPAQGHAHVAFCLLADCIYDRKTNYFSHDPLKYYAYHILLWKFWQYQTGGGLIYDRSKMGELQWLIDHYESHSEYKDPERENLAREILYDFGKHQEKIQSAHDRVTGAGEEKGYAVKETSA